MLLTFFAFNSGYGSSTSSLSGSTSDPDTPADLDIPAIVEAIVGSEITLALDNNNKPTFSTSTMSSTYTPALPAQSLTP